MRQILSLISLALFLTELAGADCPSKDIVPNSFLIRLKKVSRGPTPSSFADSFRRDLQNRGVLSETVFDSSLEFERTVFESEKLPPTLMKLNIVNPADFAFVAGHTLVESIEPNCYRHLLDLGVTDAATNDPRFKDQWGLKEINADNAWNISSGSKGIVIGISDTGIDYLHEDLKDNMWINTAEIPGNGIDDDHNGCVDDIYGCDFAEGTGDPMPTNDNLIHGTHVAGIAGAVGNNGVGITGVNRQVKLMALKGFDRDGTGDISALIKTIYYGVQKGARVINCSWGGEGNATQAEKDAFKYAKDKGVVVVVAAGNDNKDASGFNPANLPTVITVAATDKSDQIAEFSNWGSVVDLAAPGGKGFTMSGSQIDSILSTIPRFAGNYGGMMGTSMAAPFVAGMAALILSVNPGLNPDQVLKVLQDGGDLIHVTTYQSGKKFDYKRISALNSLKIAQDMIGVAGTGGSGSKCDPSSPNCNASENLGSSTTPNSKVSLKSSGCGLVIKDKEPPSSTAAFWFLSLLIPVILAIYLRYLTARTVKGSA